MLAFAMIHEVNVDWVHEFAACALQSPEALGMSRIRFAGSRRGLNIFKRSTGKTSAVAVGSGLNEMPGDQGLCSKTSSTIERHCRLSSTKWF